MTRFCLPWSGFLIPGNEPLATKEGVADQILSQTTEGPDGCRGSGGGGGGNSGAKGESGTRWGSPSVARVFCFLKKLPDGNGAAL